MEVTVKVRADVAPALHSGEPATLEAQQLQGTAAELGSSLNALHPQAEDPLLAPWFTVEVPDREAADRTVAALLENEAVEAAYVKPPEELP